MIEFDCNSCGTHYRVKTELAGKKSKCRKCGQALFVPNQGTQAASRGSPTPANPFALDVAPVPAQAQQTRPRTANPRSRWLLIWIAIGGGTLLVAVVVMISILLADKNRAGMPASIDQGGGEAEARSILKVALDCWTFRDDITTFEKKHPNASIFEVEWAAGSILQRYEITGSRKNDGALGGHDFSVILTFQSQAGTDLKKNRVYHVYKGGPLGPPGLWHINQ